MAETNGGRAQLGVQEDDIAEQDTGFDTGGEADDADCMNFVGAGCHSSDSEFVSEKCIKKDDNDSLSGGDIEQGPYVGAGTCSVAPNPGMLPLLCILFVWFRRVLVLLFALGLAVSGEALALDVQQLQTLEGGRWVALREADFGEKYALNFVYGMNYARAPLSEMRSDGAGTDAVVEGVMSAELAASMNLGIVQVGFGVPYHVVSLADNRPVGAVGDGALWLGTRIPLGSESNHLSLVGRLEGMSSAQFVSGSAVLINIAYETRSPVWGFAVNSGVRFQEEEQETQYNWGDRFEYGAGLSWSRQKISLKVEWIGSVPLYKLEQKGQFPMELLAGTHADVSKRVRVHAGLGRGMAGGIGSPEWRVYSMLELRPDVHKDNDRDGIVNLVDRCPNKPEDKDDFRDGDGCPDLDDDRDGIADVDDQCRLIPETYNDYLDSDGCPDRTGYAMVQVVGQERESFNFASLTVGANSPMKVLEGDVTVHRIYGGSTLLSATAEGHAPRSRLATLESDGETVAITIRLGEADQVAKPPIQLAKGCSDGEVPPCVPENENRIQLNEPIAFELDSIELTDVSQAILDELVGFLTEHPEIELLRVEGFADEFGGSAYNYDLSWRRARAVTHYLISQGVPEERLAPLATGEALRSEREEALRRVEFTVLIWADLDGSPAPKLLIGKNKVE